MKKALYAEIISQILLALFLYAGVSKLVTYKSFVIQIGQSPMLTAYAPVLAVIVPLAEFIIAVMLFTKKWRLPGLYASLAIMVLFTTYIYCIMHYSETIPCSCGGILQHMNWTQHLIFNIVITGLTIPGIL